MVRRDIITEDGAVAQELLNSNCDESILYDVIVIGSGMGGGVVASALADEGKKVLVLEAGSLLFPTHVGNLPRRLQIGKFQKQIWSLYDRFTVKNYDKVNDGEYSAYSGAQAFNLGGRSMFWGASIPELAQWELDAWPKSIQQYLTDDGYKLAKQTFNSRAPELKAFHGVATDKIQKVLGDSWTVEPAAVAVEYAGITEWAVPSGVFSTADLLIEDAMVEGALTKQGVRCPLTVNLHHQAWNLCMDGDRVDGVNCFDLLAKKQRTYRASAVVLAAGTLESTKIALQSNLSGPLIGKGITDHPIWYRHFVIPPHSKALNGLVDLYDMEPESTKIIIRHKSATIQNHGFDIVLELGSQWNQGRFVDHDHIEDDLKTRKGYMLCEIVFQFYSELEDSNCVTLQGWNKPVKVSMKKCPTPLLHEARQIASNILREFEADQVMGEGLDLYCPNDGLVNLEEAKVGGVAHEVGTLRMPSYGKKGVVDHHLKFEGYSNLFVCDNSVFPCSPAGNPSLTLVALARRCAKDIVKTLHKEPLSEELPIEVPRWIKYPLHKKYHTEECFMAWYTEARARFAPGTEHATEAWYGEENRIEEEAKIRLAVDTRYGRYDLHEMYTSEEFEQRQQELIARGSQGLQNDNSLLVQRSELAQWQFEEQHPFKDAVVTKVEVVPPKVEEKAEVTETSDEVEIVKVAEESDVVEVSQSLEKTAINQTDGVFFIGEGNIEETTYSRSETKSTATYIVSSEVKTSEVMITEVREESLWT